MTGFDSGNGGATRMDPRSRDRMWPRNGPDRAAYGIIGVVCAVVGLLVSGPIGLLLGLAAVVAGRLSMGRRWNNRAVPGIVAVVLGAIDVLAALVSLL